MVGAFVRNFPFGTELAFLKGFKRLGDHVVTTVDPSVGQQDLDETADVTLIFKSTERLDMGRLHDCRGVRVVYQPDDSRFDHIRNLMGGMRAICDFALTFDEAGAAAAVGLGYRKSRRLWVTADDELYVPLDVERDIDVSFVGSLTDGENHRSRRRMVRVLASAGYNVGIASDLYDVDRIVDIYNRSKVVLNHATDVGQPFGHGYGFQCRHFEVGFTRSCLLSNLVDDGPSPGRPVGYVDFDSEETLVERVGWLLSDRCVRETVAAGYFNELMAGHRPEHRAAEMVSFFEEIV